MKKTLLILIIILFNSSLFADDKMDLALEVFNNKVMCGTCHALEAAGSEG